MHNEQHTNLRAQYRGIALAKRMYALLNKYNTGPTSNYYYLIFREARYCANALRLLNKGCGLNRVSLDRIIHEFCTKAIPRNSLHDDQPFEHLDLSNLDLQGAKFTGGKKISWTDFSNSNLSLSKIPCSFNDCKFNHANLTETSLEGEEIRFCTFEHTNCSGLILRGGKTLTSCVLFKCIVKDASLQELILEDCSVACTDFSEAATTGSSDECSTFELVKGLPFPCYKAQE